QGTRPLPCRSLRFGVVARRSAPRSHRIHDAIDTERYRTPSAVETTCSRCEAVPVFGIMKTRIPGLKQYKGRNANGYFQNLDWPVRQRAYYWLGVFCKRWGRNLPRWRFAILVGQANRIAKNPPTSHSSIPRLQP